MGGILVGEHMGFDQFRIIDISFQKSGGALAHFVRDPKHHKAFLADFFARTGNDYQRFNYIGEWHSHPLFEPIPSDKDIRTMSQLVIDPDVGVNFAVLIIVRLRGWSRLRISSTMFQPGRIPEDVAVEIEPEAVPSARKRSRYRFICL